MSRRKRSVLDALVLLPWWVSLLFGAFAYMGIRFAIPAVLPESPLLPAVSKGMEPLAIFMFLLFGAVALLSAFRARTVAKKWEQQKGVQELAMLTWQQFEYLMGEAFRRQGYRVMENGGGVFVTLGHYTDDAKQFATTCGMQLIDAFGLADMIRDGETEAESDLQAIAPPAITTFRPDNASCPRCGKSMVMRTAKQGANTGKRFWGCPGYPVCRGTREI